MLSSVPVPTCTVVFLDTTCLAPPQASRRSPRVLEHREPRERREDPGCLYPVGFLFLCWKTFLPQMTLPHSIGQEEPSSSAGICSAVFFDWQTVLEKLSAHSCEVGVCGHVTPEARKRRCRLQTGSWFQRGGGGFFLMSALGPEGVESPTWGL